MVVALKKRYGSPRLNNKDCPLDELIFILLSQMTTGPSYERVFDRLKVACWSWEQLLDWPASALASLIGDAGLSNQKTRHIHGIAARLKADFGQVSLAPLLSFKSAAAFDYLTSLPGVGSKTAKCVMMFSLGHKVLPVDTHTARVAFRLGLLSRQNFGATLDREIEEVVAPALRYDFHVNAVAHGRIFCKALRPVCLGCPLLTLCPCGREATPEPPPIQ